jgi:uncharacterized protein (TIGR02246 family)
MMTVSVDTHGLQRLIDRLAAATHAHDAAEFARCFLLEGELILGYGRRACGQAQIERLYRPLLATVLNGTVAHIASLEVRPLSDDRYAALLAWSLSGGCAGYAFGVLLRAPREHRIESLYLARTQSPAGGSLGEPLDI